MEETSKSIQSPEIQVQDKGTSDVRRFPVGKLIAVVLVALFLIRLFQVVSVGDDNQTSTEGTGTVSERINAFIDRLQGQEEGTQVSHGDVTINVNPDEKRVIDVVQQNMESVVSIAVNEFRFSQTEGVIDISNNIGSGFIVDSDGLIITNQHVVSDRNSDYQVITQDGDSYDIVEIVRDDVNDVALLKIDAVDLNAIDLGDSDALAPGQTVIAIGTPLGEYAGSVTTGVISGLERSVTTSSGGFFSINKTFENVIQTDAAINPGNSGGPLLNTAGQVIGVNFATTSGADNISFALPINFVKSRIDEYKRFGKFLRPYFGIEYQNISQEVANSYDDIVAGAFVRSVRDGSPAQKAGVQRGDIVTKINGDDVGRSFSSIIQRYDVGEEIEVSIYRNGATVELTAILKEADS